MLNLKLSKSYFRLQEFKYHTKVNFTNIQRDEFYSEDRDSASGSKEYCADQKSKILSFPLNI